MRWSGQAWRRPKRSKMKPELPSYNCLVNPLRTAWTRPPWVYLLGQSHIRPRARPSEAIQCWKTRASCLSERMMSL